MSLAGFQRRRRELAKLKELGEQSRIEESDTSEQSTIEDKEPTNAIDIDDITKDEIVEILTGKGIEHNPRDKKEVLYELLVEGE